ncbi:MAG: hypothetical protein Q8L66_05690 [Caulobacter sp.]|nr:hypothetical protein [Caulobacter sp.]
MARKPNYNFERAERERQKAAKTAAKAAAKAAAKREEGDGGGPMDDDADAPAGEN